MRVLKLALDRIYFRRKHSRKSAQELLDGIQIAAPCPVSWESMDGDEKMRFCRSCKLNVYNISELSAQSAFDLIREKQGQLCIQLYRRRDGTVLTQDCPEGLKRLRQAAFRRAACLVAALGWIGNAPAGAQTPLPTAETEPMGNRRTPCNLPLRGTPVPRSLDQIVKGKPAIEHMPPDLRSNAELDAVTKPGKVDECERHSKMTLRWMLSLAVLGIALASFRRLRRQSMWILGVSLVVVFMILGFTWM